MTTESIHTPPSSCFSRPSLPGDRKAAGFTLTELITVILLLGVVSIAVLAKWPSGMRSQAAKLEYLRAVRYAQHMALTRKWTSAADAWGISISGDKYYVGRADADCRTSCGNPQCGDQLMCDRSLLGDSSISIVPASATTTILFNGLGEPIDATGSLLPSVSFTLDGSVLVTVCAETGYLQDGGTCP